VCAFEVLFNGVSARFGQVSTRLGLRSFEKCFENSFPNVCSIFQNLRLGSINLKNREKAGLSKRGMSCRRLHDTPEKQTRDIRPRNPRFEDVHTGTKSRLVDKRAIGIWGFRGVHDMDHNFMLPKRRCGKEEIDEMRMFDALFNG
jgi:hypothetical protein